MAKLNFFEFSSLKFLTGSLWTISANFNLFSDMENFLDFALWLIGFSLFAPTIFCIIILLVNRIHIHIWLIVLYWEMTINQLFLINFNRFFWFGMKLRTSRLMNSNSIILFLYFYNALFKKDSIQLISCKFEIYFCLKPFCLNYSGIVKKCC